MQITVTDEQTFINASRIPVKASVFKNTGEDTVYFGFEEATAASGEDQGIPLAAGETLTMAGEDLELGRRVFFICATDETTTVNYTLKA